MTFISNRINKNMNESIDIVALNSLEERVNTLHKAIFSSAGNESGQKPIILLEQAHRTLKELERKHSVITHLWKKLPQLDEYLSTDFLQKVGLNDEVKTSLVLANEENLKNLSNHIKELNALKSVVNHHSLKDVQQHSAKLEPIIQLHINQMDESYEVSERLNKLLTAYNNIINTLSKQFMLWNNLVTQCELALDMERDVIE